MSLKPCSFEIDKKRLNYDQMRELLLDRPDLVEIGMKTKPEAKPTPETKLSSAFEKWKASQQKLGIAFNPKSGVDSDIEFLKAIVEYLKEKLAQGAHSFKDFMNDLREYGIDPDEYESDWKDVYDGAVGNKKPEAKSEPTREENMVEKTVVDRLNKGTKDEKLQAELEKLGLFRPVYSLEEPTIKGKALYDKLGNEGSLNALENPNIDVMTKLGVHRALTEGIQQQLESNTDPETAALLISQQAKAMNLASSLVSSGGLILRYWQDTLDNSIIPYDYESKVKQMRTEFSEYYEKHKEQIEADFKKAQEMMDKANADRQKLENDIAEWELKRGVENLQEAFQREKEKPKSRPVTTKWVKQDRYEAANKRLMERRLFSGTDPNLIADLAIVARL